VTGNARIAPLSTEELPEDAAAVLRSVYPEAAANRLLTEAGALPNVLGTLLRHPRLAGPFLAYNNVLLTQPTLEPRLRELLVLRVSWLARSRYEWAQHVRLSARFGITTAQLTAIASGPESTEWSELESLALRATDQLVGGYRIDDETWAALADHLDTQQLVELVFVIGTYTGLAMAFNSFCLQLEPDLQDLTAASMPRFEE
jgi:alkylhydroperoxidase family enzyme